MMIACPACSTRYAVSDDAIGVDGRVVRCAKCRHSWFQDGAGIAEPGAETDVEPEIPSPAPAAPPPVIAPTPVPPVEAAPLSAYSDPPKIRDFAETPSSFAYEPPFRPRRNRATAWLMAAIVVALVAIAAIGAIVQFGVPDWLPLPRGAFAEAEPGLVLDFPQDRQERRPLPNGGDFFNVSGTIRNVGSGRQTVPTLLIVLRDTNRNIVYSLETAPPKPVLAPGESEAVNQAIIDAPSSARAAEIGWKPR